MSHKATNWAVMQRGISAAAKVLLWQLADRHHPDNGCFPVQATLERDCELARSTLNERLKELEKAGLVKREVRHHPVTKRRLPTRYYLAFEDEFESVPGRSGGDEETGVFAVEADESHVRKPDMENEGSHVRNSGRAMSGTPAEPCPAGRTYIKGLTSKLTSKRTSKRATRVDRVSIFEAIWKVFPLRPGSPQMDAWHIFEQLDEADLDAVRTGAERFALWFREEAARKGDDFEEAVRFAPYLANWLKGQKWYDARTLPVTVTPGTEAAIVMDGTETVNKWTHSALFEACERVRGKRCPVGASGSWTFPGELVTEARRQLGARARAGPP